MKKWLIGIGATLCIVLLLLAGLYGLYEWDNRDLSIEEMRALRPEYKQRALTIAAEKLPYYAAKEGLDQKEFRGPYIRKDDNPEEPTFTVGYKSNTYYFVYFQSSDMYDFYNITNGECDSSACQWLKIQP